jgi:hypothetical protein
MKTRYKETDDLIQDLKLLFKKHDVKMLYKEGCSIRDTYSEDSITIMSNKPDKDNKNRIFIEGIDELYELLNDQKPRK